MDEYNAKMNAPVGDGSKFKLNKWYICVAIVLLIALLSSRHSGEHTSSASVPVPSQASQDRKRVLNHEAVVYMRGRGFTAEDSAQAILAAEQADPELGSATNVLIRMAASATIGFMNEQTLNSLGITASDLDKASGLKNGDTSNHWNVFKPSLRLEILSDTMLKVEDK